MKDTHLMLPGPRRWLLLASVILASLSARAQNTASFNGALTANHGTWDRMTTINVASHQQAFYEVKRFEVTVEGQYTITVSSGAFAPSINLFQTKFFPTTPAVNFWDNGVVRTTAGTLQQTTFLAVGTFDLVISTYTAGQTGAYTGSIAGPGNVAIETNDRPLTMLTPPLAKNLRLGQAGDLSVVVEGAYPHSFQWYEGQAGDTSHPIPGAISDTFVTPGATVPSERSFWVRATNPHNSVDSAAVILKWMTGTQTFSGDLRPESRQWFRSQGRGGVNDWDTYYKVFAFRVTTLGTYTFHPQSQGFGMGLDLYSIFIPGSPNVNHYTFGEPLTATFVAPTTFYLVISANGDHQTGTYNGYIEGPGYLTELPAPKFTEQPVAVQYYWPFEPQATLRVGIDTQNAALEWRYWPIARGGPEHSDLLVQGANGPTYTPTPTNVPRWFWARASNQNGYDDSQLAAMLMRPAPSFSRHPEPVTLTYGATTTLTATAKDIPFDLQWLYTLNGETNHFFSKVVQNYSPSGNYIAESTTELPLPVFDVGVHQFQVRTHNPAGTNFSRIATITIQKQPLTAIAQPVTRMYGTPNPLLTGSFTGVTNDDPITVSFVTAALTGSPVGSYDITPVLSDPRNRLSNYAVTLEKAAVTITKAPLMARADSFTRVYGQPFPVLTGTFAGVQNGDNLTVTYQTVAAATGPVGTFEIVPVIADPDGKLGNYDVTIERGTFVLSKASLTASANSFTRVYGQPNPVFTGTFAGVVNGDDITVAYHVSANAASPVGTYTITPALTDPASKLGNYEVTVQNSSLTITKAALVVTANNASRRYGSANPAFSSSFTGARAGDNLQVSYATAATPASDIGSYAITPDIADPDGRLGNYQVTIRGANLTVTKAPLSVYGNLSRPYGQGQTSYPGDLIGLRNNDPISATYQTPANANSPVGVYPATGEVSDPSGKLPNYALTIHDGQVSVTPKNVIVEMASSLQRAYGATNPPLAGRVPSFLPADGIVVTYGTTATATSPVGNYPVTATLADPQGKLSNYRPTILPGNLRVVRAELQISGRAFTRVYGQPNPAITGSLDGLVSGDNITATFRVNANPASPAAKYPILASLSDPDQRLANYLVTTNYAVMLVDRAPLTVVVDDKTRLRGNPNPVLTGAITGLVNGDAITLSLSTKANLQSQPGVYPITAKLVDPQDRAGNYQVTITPGTLTITPTPDRNGTDDLPRVAGLDFVNGQARLSFTGVPGKTYMVEATENLGDPDAWEPLGTATADAEGRFDFADTDIANHTRRFYGAFQMP